MVNAVAMQISFELLPDDLLAFAAHHYEHSPTMRRSRRRYQIGGAAAILIMISVLGLQASSGLYILVGTVAALLWAIAYPFYVRWSLLGHAKRMFAEGSNSALLGTHRLDVRGDGIACKSPKT
jgi:hypothetical protein